MAWMMSRIEYWYVLYTKIKQGYLSKPNHPGTNFYIWNRQLFRLYRLDKDLYGIDSCSGYAG